MKNRLFRTFIAVILALTLSSFSSGGSDKIVYISTSPKAHAYHVWENCHLLQRTTYTIKAVPIQYARQIGRIPCKKCSKGN